MARSFCGRASSDFFVPGILSYLSKLCALRAGGGKKCGFAAVQCNIHVVICNTKKKEKKRKSTHPMLECEQFSPITQDQSPQELVMCNVPVIKQWEYVKNQGMEWKGGWEVVLGMSSPLPLGKPDPLSELV